MQILRAPPEDAPLLTEIAFASKRHWGYAESWIEEWRGLLTIRPEFVAGHEVWMAVQNPVVVAFYALVQKADDAELLHFWVHPESMRRGIGREMFGHAANKARQLGCKALNIESDPNAEGFYVRMGAHRIGIACAKVAGHRRELPLLAYDLCQHDAHP